MSGVVWVRPVRFGTPSGQDKDRRGPLKRKAGLFICPAREVAHLLASYPLDTWGYKVYHRDSSAKGRGGPRQDGRRTLWSKIFYSPSWDSGISSILVCHFHHHRTWVHTRKRISPRGTRHWPDSCSEHSLSADIHQWCDFYRRGHSVWDYCLGRCIGGG